MNLIQNYQNFNVLQRILFWGKTVVILLAILLLIIFILRRKKNQKVKIIHFSDDVPILKEEKSKEPQEEIFVQEQETLGDAINLELLNDNIEEANELKQDESQEERKKEEVVKNKEEDNTIIELTPKIIQEEKKYKSDFQMPSAPYQRNVLREMSLSQTSPIGINKRQGEYIKQESAAKEELKDTLITKQPQEIIQESKIEPTKIIYEQNAEELKEPIVLEETPELEVIDEYEEDIERTDYEIEQEENAIISYKELMEKKDSIKTIDEEEAIISIEELLNKTSYKKEEPKEEQKLYNITEEEENDSFLNELKKFRKDL